MTFTHSAAVYGTIVNLVSGPCLPRTLVTSTFEGGGNVGDSARGIGSQGGKTFDSRRDTDSRKRGIRRPIFVVGGATSKSIVLASCKGCLNFNSRECFFPSQRYVSDLKERNRLGVRSGVALSICSRRKPMNFHERGKRRRAKLENGGCWPRLDDLLTSSRAVKNYIQDRILITKQEPKEGLGSNCTNKRKAERDYESAEHPS